MRTAENEQIENGVDEQWLDAIAANWKFLTGKLWETRDGECREEGVQANVSALFQHFEDQQEGMVSKEDLQPTIELLTRLVGHYFEPQIAHYRIVNEIARLKTLLGEKGEK